MIDDHLQQRENQITAIVLIVIGLGATCIGCHFHWVELTTAASAVWGGGLLLLKSNAILGKPE